MSELEKSLDRFNFLLEVIIGGSLFIPSLVGYLKLESYLVLFPVIMYIIWIVYHAYVLPRILLRNYKELQFLENMIGWLYVFSLAVALIGNYILMSILPRTLFTFYGGIIIVSTTLGLIYKYIPALFFRFEIISLTEKETDLLSNMLKNYISTAIFLSVGILIINIDIINVFFLKEQLEIDVISLFMMLIIIIYFIIRSRQASQIKKQLSISMINSNWYSKYSKLSK